jgi:hypothetical protein
MLEAMQAAGRASGYRAVIAGVRPTEKHRYPLLSIERYAEWMRPDGLPFDPWIRLHVRPGGRIVRAAPESMRIHGSVTDWAGWDRAVVPRQRPIHRADRDVSSLRRSLPVRPPTGHP